MANIKESLDLLKAAGSYFIDKESKTYLTRESLGKIIALDFNESINYIKDLEDTLKVIDIDAYNLLVKEIKASCKEAGLFKLELFLNPNLFIVYKDLVCRNFYKLGTNILDDKVDKELVKEMMNNHLISYFAKIKDIDYDYEGTIDKIIEAEDYLNTNSDVALSYLGFILSRRNYYTYRNKKFTSVICLKDYLKSRGLFNRFSNTFEKDYNFIGWVYYLGKQHIYEDWTNKIA